MPLEAMRMGLPVFASDRDFVRAVCSDGAVYFSPDDPRDAARIVARTLADGDELARLAKNRGKVMASLWRAPQRAAALADLVTAQLSRANRRA